MNSLRQILFELSPKTARGGPPPAEISLYINVAMNEPKGACSRTNIKRVFYKLLLLGQKGKKNFVMSMGIKGNNKEGKTRGRSGGKPRPEAEFKEFERRFKYGCFHL